MDERQRAILAKAVASDSPLCASILEYAEELAEATLAEQIFLNGYLIYKSVKD